MFKKTSDYYYFWIQLNYTLPVSSSWWATRPVSAFLLGSTTPSTAVESLVRRPWSFSPFSQDSRAPRLWPEGVHEDDRHAGTPLRYISSTSSSEIPLVSGTKMNTKMMANTRHPKKMSRMLRKNSTSAQSLLCLSHNDSLRTDIVDDEGRKVL